MNILIFGATGGTGRQLITQGLSQGHKITAFVRNPAKLSINNKNLLLVKGSVSIQENVEAAMQGQDVVISVLGSNASDSLWKSNTIVSDAVKNIILGMKKKKVARLLFIASFGVNKKIFLPEKLFIRIFLRNVFADILKQQMLIEQSELDWTIAHPARLVDSPKTGNYKVSEDLPIGLFSNVSRSDVADFLLKNLNSTRYHRKIVTI